MTLKTPLGATLDAAMSHPSTTGPETMLTAPSAADTATMQWRSATIGRFSSIAVRLRRSDTTLWRLSILLGPAAAPILLLLLSLPQVLPIGIPGTGVALAVPMLFLAAGLLRDRQRLEMPRFIGRRRLESQHLVRLFSALDRLLVGLERFSRPRADHLLNRGMRICIVGTIVLMVTLIMLPLPTGNPPAAAAVMAFAVGLLRRDGLVVLVGAALALIAVAWNGALAVLIFVAGVEIWSIL